MGLLGDIYSGIDTQKRRLRGLLDDPAGTLALGVTRFSEDQNSLLNLMRNAYPTAGENTVLNSPQQIAQFRGELADKGAEQAMAAATVWHGSPHKFDKFDSSKIGTGEGAQAYGHGLYLAENPEVAKEYAHRLSKNAYVDTKPEIMAASNASHKAQITYLQAVLDKSSGKTVKAPIDELKAEFERLSSAHSQAVRDFGPQQYKVDLPDDQIARFLDWDKPLSQQNIQTSPFAAAQKSALESMSSSFGPRDIPMDVARDIASSKTGAQLYDMMKSQHGPDRAAQMMRDAGIPGIRYLDGGSRGVGQGSSNYVVFPGNEGLLSIIERNGKQITR